MRFVDTQNADVVVRAQARLARLLRRPDASGLHLLAGLMPGRIDPEDAAAYDEAAREAFRAGTTLGALRPFAADASPEPSSSTSGAARPDPWVSAPTASPAAAGVARVSAPTPPAPASAGELARERAAAGRPARRPRHQAGETAPESLLRTPTSVVPIADDFFDSILRRVEGDR